MLCASAYKKGEYREALDAALRINTPGYFHAHDLRAAAFGQLGQREEAQKALKELLTLRPDFATSARREYAKWWNAEMVEHLVDSLRKAGPDVAVG